MAIIGKVTPRVYEYLRALGKGSILETKPLTNFNPNGLRFDFQRAKSLRYTDEEIAKAYRAYEKSPYVNTYMRSNTPMTEESNKIVSCLKQGIQNSEPISGKFYRGVMNCSTVEDAEKFVFENNAFTSVAPEANKRFAETFALGRNGAVIEFDLNQPVKAFQSNNYEVLFKPNAFSREDYQITKVKDGVFKVTERLKHAIQTPAHYDEGGTIAFGYMPDNYLNKTEYFFPEKTYVARFGPKKGQTITSPARKEEIQTRRPYYTIKKLQSGGKGTGTTAIQELVKKSVADPRTEGRVIIDAQCIDGKTYPAGFYYKLGFRFGNPIQNEHLEQWLQAGGKREANICETGMMFLPKENIEHCLNYGKKNI